MLKVLREDSTREIEISGTRSDLLALGRNLRSGQGAFRMSKVSNPFLYGRSLSRIEFRQSSGKVKPYATKSDDLEVQGGLEALALLADNIESFTLDADQDDHLHVDYFPEHNYLAEGSESLVVGIEDDTSKSS
jgi:hypothetical protein